MAPEKESALSGIFDKAKPLIGNLHCPALPGTPAYRSEPVGELVRRAVADAQAYAQGGMDGLLIENHGDIPFLKPNEIGPEIVATMAVIARAISEAVALPFGIHILANYAAGGLAVGKATGARFIRVNQWVNAYVSNEGFLEGESARVLRYRKQIDAEDIAIFADVHVKHGAHALVGDRGISEQARDVEFYSADVAIATGNRTGESVPMEEISAIREGTRLPVIAGSGISSDNVASLFESLDGAIVGSSLKHGGVWWNAVDVFKVHRLVEETNRLRDL